MSNNEDEKKEEIAAYTKRVIKFVLDTGKDDMARILKTHTLRQWITNIVYADKKITKIPFEDLPKIIDVVDAQTKKLLLEKQKNTEMKREVIERMKGSSTILDLIDNFVDGVVEYALEINEEVDVKKVDGWIRPVVIEGMTNMYLSPETVDSVTRSIRERLAWKEEDDVK